MASRNITGMVTAEVTMHGEVQMLRARLQHLLKSETVRVFDAVDPHTGYYKKDIRELDVTVAGASRKVLYLCDRRACDFCSDHCNHTSDIRHAVNFKNEMGVFREQSE